jgi:hypothetical protein
LDLTAQEDSIKFYQGSFDYSTEAAVLEGKRQEMAEE